MKRKLIILFFAICSLLFAQAQIVQPVKWNGEQIGDSVRLTATIEDGWHMTLISIGDEQIGEEIFESSYTLTLAESQPIRFNACNDNMCTAPEIWEYSENMHVVSETNDATEAADLLMIFLMGLLGGLLAIFTPCVWPIIPMTVSFFLKRTDKGARNAVLYGLSIIIDGIFGQSFFFDCFLQEVVDSLTVNVLLNGGVGDFHFVPMHSHLGQKKTFQRFTTKSLIRGPTSVIDNTIFG